MQIGFVVLLNQRPELGRVPRYTEVREMALRAEATGFDSIWLYDHLLYRSPGQPTRGIWECWTMVSALAEATRHVEVGTLVLCNQFRNPALVAKMASTLDEVSHGRFVLGVGAGWNEPEFHAFGMPFDHRVGRLEEALQIITPLLKTGHVDFAGKYYQARDCEITPRGPRGDGPPVLIGGLRPRMLGLAAQYADMWSPMAYLNAPGSFCGASRQGLELVGDARAIAKLVELLVALAEFPRVCPEDQATRSLVCAMPPGSSTWASTCAAAQIAVPRLTTS